MSYTVFARKYRPQGFDDVVGQGAVARTLKNAVRADRVAHAYLFAGPRGVGKTSMARILAKALNCASPVDAEPCNACDPCTTITSGRNFDVDEFDAASNRKVEDVERLLERVRQPRPVRDDSRSRVFIVDEVHMMTTHAFNALLKTLEEPPGHVKFIFATTEPEKVPETILSRCQRFDFKRIGPDDVVGRLRGICEREGLEAEDRALRLIARRARGGMRDAQSLLDQAVALAATGDGQTVHLAADRLEAALGMAPRERVHELLQAIAAHDVKRVLTVLDAVYRDGLDASELCSQVARTARDILALVVGGEGGAALLDDPGLEDELAPLAKCFGIERCLQILGTAVELERRVQLARDERVLVELAFVKLAHLPDLVRVGEALQRLEALEARLGGAAPGGAAGYGAPTVPAPPAGQPPAQSAAPAPSAPASTGPAGTGPARTAPARTAPSRPAASPPREAAPQSQAPQRAAPASPPPSGPLRPKAVADAIPAVRRAIAAERRSAAASLGQARVVGVRGDDITLALDNAFASRSLTENPETRARLNAAFTDALGRPVTVTVTVEAPEEAPKSLTRREVLADPEVKKVLDHTQGGALLGFERIDPRPGGKPSQK